MLGVAGWGVFYTSLHDYARLFHLSLPHFQFAKQEYELISVSEQCRRVEAGVLVHCPPAQAESRA